MWNSGVYGVSHAGLLSSRLSLQDQAVSSGNADELCPQLNGVDNFSYESLRATKSLISGRTIDVTIGGRRCM
ncbi:unnamed protein product [Cylicocyclus nassatus]|uniref:Uncharacterized protein n=1 Tax=Cylicocyclus nassatus TaxID=53992 RepID=A0AA36HC10_CYLNA|nr:unnamed protein product [Cylicocyclus nassatus]